jgi:hypothetical protein
MLYRETMPPKHVLQQAASAHHWHVALIAIAIVVLVCGTLAAIGYVVERRQKQTK